MHNHSRKETEYQVELSAAAETSLPTEYAGVVLLQQLWKAIGVGKMLAAAGIQYGNQAGAAEDMSFMLNVQPWIRSHSQRRTVQRFGGEPSAQELEAGPLLAGLIAQSYSQRRLNRFVNTARYDWPAFNRERLAYLQAQPLFRVHEKGVIIVDGFPLPKPYANAMTHLTPIWDNNLKRSVPGYAVVHVYYYHPKRLGYSLYLEPWLKTSATGETGTKRSARRRARPGEERSKLDIALEALLAHQDLVSQVEYVLTAGQYCSGTGTGSTRFYRVCNDLSLVLLLFIDLLLFIGCMFLLKHDIKKLYAFLVVIAYGIYALLSPFLWDLPFFLTSTH